MNRRKAIGGILCLIVICSNFQNLSFAYMVIFLIACQFPVKQFYSNQS